MAGRNGARALRPNGGPSSFVVFDVILRALLDRSRLPALRTVVVAGHSAGGQVVQRYAATGRADAEVRAAGIALRYVVANPSAYLYFDDRRVTADGALASFPRAICPGFNQLHIVPGVGHDHARMFGSPCGLRQLFGDGRC